MNKDTALTLIGSAISYLEMAREELLDTCTPSVVRTSIYNAVAYAVEAAGNMEGPSLPPMPTWDQLAPTDGQGPSENHTEDCGIAGME